MKEADVRRIASQIVDGVFVAKKGIITSYDPAVHKAKVKIQPDDLETGWLPVGSFLVGNEFGISYGLTPGDEVLVHFENGDLNAGVVGMALYASETPYPAKPGAFMITHKSGSYLRFFNDGYVQLNAQEKLILKAQDGITLSTPGRIITNAGETQGFVTDSVPGGDYNSALHVDHEESG